MAIVKSEIIKELKKSYPNFLKKDLHKIVEIIIKQIKDALQRDEGVEIRYFGTYRTNLQKPSIRRNPKTGEKVSVPKKRTIKWKMSKDLFKKLNNES